IIRGRSQEVRLGRPHPVERPARHPRVNRQLGSCTCRGTPRRFPMNDLQQFLRAHESGLAQSFSDLEEFDATRAHRKVVAKRRTRTILVTGAAALTLAGAAGLASLTLGSDVWQPGTDTTINDQSG